MHLPLANSGLHLNVNHIHTCLTSNLKIGQNLVEFTCTNLFPLEREERVRLNMYSYSDAKLKDYDMTDLTTSQEEQLLILKLLNPKVLRKLILSTT